MKNDKRIIFYLGLFISASLILIRDLAGIAIPGIVIAGWVGTICSIVNRKDMYLFAYSVLPLAVGVPGYTFLLLLLILLFRQEKLNARQIIPFIILGCLEIVNVMGYSFYYDISGVVSFLSFLFLFFLMIFTEDSNIDRKQCLLYYSLGLSFALVVAYGRIILDSGFGALIAGELRAGAAMGNYEDEQLDNHLMMNANCIAYYSLTLLSLAVVFLSKKYNSRLLLYGFILIAIITGLLSFSRTWMLVTGIIFIWFIMSNNRNKKTIVGFLLLFLLMTIIGAYIGLVDEVLQVFEFRMENDNVESAGGRLPLFKAYHDFVTSNVYYIFFGTGATYYKQVCQLWNSVHNGTQQIFVSFGIVGLLTYLFAAKSFVKHYMNYRVKDNLILLTPFVTCLIFVQSIQFLNPYPLMLPFVAAACALRINE